MFRIFCFLTASVALLTATGLTAQSVTPPANWILNDLQHVVSAPPPPAEGKYTEVDGRRFVRIDPTPTRIWTIAFSQDGRFLAAGKDYGRIVIWDVGEKRVSCVIDAGTGGMSRVAISPDDQFVAASGPGLRRVTLWHIPDGKQLNSFAAGEMTVTSMYFTHNPALLVYSYTASTTSTTTSGSIETRSTPAIDVVNPLTGVQVARFPGETWPVLSADGSTLMTEDGNNLILRDTADWTEQKRLAKLTPYAHPVFLDLARGWYLFWDATDDHRIVAARLSDGKMPEDVRLADLPQFSYLVPPFASIEPRSGLWFGHGSGSLWALNPKSGQTCLSPNQYSEAAALNPNGNLVASAFDSPMPTDDQKAAGIAIWKTASIAKHCRMK